MKSWTTKYLPTEHLLKIFRYFDTNVDRSLLCPEYRNIFRAFELTKPSEVRVVMLGLDPYPQKGVATGLLFANKADIPESCISPSLRVIKDAVIDRSIQHGPVTFDNTLESWAKQGVLLLNSALTCTIGNTGVHSLLWRPFMINLIKNLSGLNNGLIFVLWGNEASSFSKFIGQGRHDVLIYKHPAWYARTGEPLSPECFRKIDSLLIGKYGETIRWYEEEYSEQEDKECEDSRVQWN